MDLCTYAVEEGCLVEVATSWDMVVLSQGANASHLWHCAVAHRADEIFGQPQHCSKMSSAEEQTKSSLKMAQVDSITSGK